MNSTHQSTMEDLKKTALRIVDIMEQNNRGVQLGCYSIALAGLTYAIRRVRPFSVFKRPSDIPNHFIQERRELTGLVERIDPGGGVLIIKHKPLLPIPGLSSKGELPVKISGVNVSGLGLNWLQTIVAGNEVKFVPVAKEKNYVQCEVLLPQITRDKKLRVVNVGESLVKIGFGQVESKEIVNLPGLESYKNRLLQAETEALKKKLGIRYYIKPTKTALTILIKKLKHLINNTKPITKMKHIVSI